MRRYRNVETALLISTLLLLLEAVILGLALLYAAICWPSPASARDNGQFAQTDPKVKEWFNGLTSGRGPCCSDADGTAVSDPDWVAKKDKDGAWHYQVRLDNRWIEVPDDAVLTVPNLAGKTMVWPIRYPGHVIFIRCFIPGVMI